MYEVKESNKSKNTKHSFIYRMIHFDFLFFCGAKDHIQCLNNIHIVEENHVNINNLDLNHISMIYMNLSRDTIVLFEFEICY